MSCLDPLLCLFRTVLCPAFLTQHALDPAANKNRAVHRRESASPNSRSVVDAGHLSLRMHLRGGNIECRLREKHIHLHGLSERRRALRSYINTAAAYVAAPAFAAVQGPVFIAPGEHHGQTQTKTFGVSPLSLRLSHNVRVPLQARASSIIRRKCGRQPLYASALMCTDDDSGMRRTTPTRRFCKSFED
jgi:hypothetical protein